MGRRITKEEIRTDTNTHKIDYEDDSKEHHHPPHHPSTKQQEDELECLRNTLENLPIGKGRRKRRNPTQLDAVFAHHWDAGDARKFNQEMRLTPIPYLLLDATAKHHKNNNCTIWEVGAHTQAADSQELSKQYPNCIFHAYEPVPQFYQQLEKHLRLAATNIIPHNYGLSNETSQFPIHTSDLAGQATYLGGAPTTNDEIRTMNEPPTLSSFGQLRSFVEAAKEAGGQVPTMMHINCEGCEWTMMPQLLHNKEEFLRQIPFLQINFHNYGKTLGQRVLEYCAITVALKETHDPVSQTPFGWERWKRKDIPTAMATTS